MKTTAKKSVTSASPVVRTSTATLKEPLMKAPTKSVLCSSALAITAPVSTATPESCMPDTTQPARVSVQTREAVASRSAIHPAVQPQRDEATLAGLDEVVLAASKGDPRAVGAIIIALGPQLLKVARSVLKHREDAADLLHDFALALLAGRAARFAPAKGHALAWLEGLLRAMGSRRRQERAEEWGLSDPDFFDYPRRFRTRGRRR